MKLHIQGQHGDGYNKCSMNYKSNIGLKKYFQVKHEFKDDVDVCNSCNKQAPHTHQKRKHDDFKNKTNLKN